MLTSKQRAMLRSMASTMDTIMQIGKGGISESHATTAPSSISALCWR